MRMGATHFLMKRLPKVATEMALHTLAYNLTPGDEHHGHPAADGRDPSIVKAGKSSSRPSWPLRQSVLTRLRPKSDIDWLQRLLIPLADSTHFRRSKLTR
jgi:hypothetical protein